ncbi:hypothetical protein HRbin17_00801 [bacterium HR17]|uniref:Uncharacterized protein n=1 Tax=Candidatus Fervidibacter japonicus TaxID=2035412 RepID=A0A2H5XAT7_9BACT|nr:hypothetical protein HRbin17_00801 [bacterium HR17]
MQRSISLPVAIGLIVAVAVILTAVGWWLFFRPQKGPVTEQELNLPQPPGLPSGSAVTPR